MVDSRCQAKVVCYYHSRIGYGDDGRGYGVTLPGPRSFEMDVTCSTVNGRCPEDPKDCMKDGAVIVTREPSNDDMEGALQNMSDDNLEGGIQNILREKRRSRGSSRGVR